VTLAVARKLIEQGRIPRDEEIVVCITGNGLKTQDAVNGLLERPVVIKPSLEEFEPIVEGTREAGMGGARRRRVTFFDEYLNWVLQWISENRRYLEKNSQIAEEKDRKLRVLRILSADERSSLEEGRAPNERRLAEIAQRTNSTVEQCREVYSLF